MQERTQRASGIALSRAEASALTRSARRTASIVERSMSRSPTAAPPPCYAMVHPGLEAIAAEEIEQDLGGEVKKTGRGIVVFRVPEIDERLLQSAHHRGRVPAGLGHRSAHHRAEDLDRIRRWTAREADWPTLLRLHHAHPAQAEGQADLSPGDADGGPARLSAAAMPARRWRRAWRASCRQAGGRSRRTPPSRSG